MTAQPITSRQRRQYLRFMGVTAEKALEEAYLNKDAIQRLIGRGGELQQGVLKLVKELSVDNQFADEEVPSHYEYPQGYRVNGIAEQTKKLRELFPGIGFADEDIASQPLPEGAEGWFAIPSIDALAARFFPEAKDPKERLCVVSNLVLTKIGESRAFTNYREGQLTPDRFRLNARTAEKFSLLAEQQKGDIWIVGASFGKRHAGRSVRRAREVMVGPEFGAYTVAVGSMLLTHPERLVSYDDLWMDVPGDEFDPDADGGFDSAPYLRFSGGEVKFSTDWVGSPGDGGGSVSLFLPQ